jgi:hypothetical protein
MKLIACVLVPVAISLVGCEPPKAAPKAAPVASAEEVRLAKEQAEVEQTRLFEECKTKIADQTAQYKKSIAIKDYWAAAGKIRRCSVILDDTKLKDMVADAEIKSFSRDVVNPKESISNRVRALERLERDYPAYAKKFEKIAVSLRQQATAKKEEDWRANRFQRSLPIGSTQNAVATTGWGYPRDINKTTTASGVREQWVYGDGKYLYFENGILTAIQE